MQCFRYLIEKNQISSFMAQFSYCHTSVGKAVLNPLPIVIWQHKAFVNSGFVVAIHDLIGFNRAICGRFDNVTYFGIRDVTVYQYILSYVLHLEPGNGFFRLVFVLKCYVGRLKLLKLSYAF